MTKGEAKSLSSTLALHEAAVYSGDGPKTLTKADIPHILGEQEHLFGEGEAADGASYSHYETPA
jgi:hypothetical protein